MINSRQKGAAFEREVAKALTAEGFPAKRGAQVNQGAIWGLSAADVVAPCLPDFHFECKRHGRARFDLDAAVDQAHRDAGTSLAVVVHRKDHCQMLVTMRFNEFCTLLRRSDFPTPTKTQP